MATRIVPLDEVAKLTFDQVNAFLGAKDCEHPCEACGHKQWRIATRIDDTAVLVSMDILLDDSGALSFVPVTCGHCENTRFFNALSIFQWVKEQEGHHGG